jgi:TonB family protein
MPEGLQRYKRTKMVLPLRVWPADHNGPNAIPQLAHTIDISPIGGRLGGLRNPLQTGQTVLLQRGKNRIQFRVIWTRQLGPQEIQAGVETTAPEQKVWGVDLPDELLPATNSQARRDRVIPAQAESPHARKFTVAALLLLAVTAAGFVCGLILTNSEQTASIVMPRTTPTVFIPAPSTPHSYGNVKVVFSGTDSLPDSNRLQVAEAPQGHVLYPEAPAANLTGTVGLKAIIATDGRVREIHVLRGNRILAEAAVQAVRFWHFTQHQLNGEPIEAETRVTISFHGRDAVSITFPSAVSNNRSRVKTNLPG